MGHANPLKRLDTSESVNFHKYLILLDACRIYATRWVHALLREDQKREVHGQAEDASDTPSAKAEGAPRGHATVDAHPGSGAASVAMSSPERPLSVLRGHLQLQLTTRVQGLRRQALAQDTRQAQPEGPRDLGVLSPAPCLAAP